MAFSFSATSLNLLKDCPRCFWLQFNEHIKRPEGIFPSLPSGMDLILKKYFDSFRGKGKLPPEIKGCGCSLYENPEQLKVWRDNNKGIRWTDKQGNVLMGAIDDLLVHDDKLVILDYKTRGYECKQDTALHYQQQLDIYNFLLNMNGFKTEQFAFLLFYYPNMVRKSGEVLFHTELKKMRVDVGNAEAVFRNALDVLGGRMPEPGKDCKYCRYASDLCSR